MHIIGFVVLILVSLSNVGKAAERDYYDILKLRRSATIDEIKKAYRRLTLKYHPDINKEKGAAQTFQDIATAYEVLSDPEKKKIYDKYGEKGLEQNMGSHPEADIFDFIGGFGGFGDFGFQQRRRGEEKAEPIEFQLYADLSQLYFGDLIHVSFYRPVICIKADDCIVKSSECAGPGVRLQQQLIGPGILVQNQIRDDSCFERGKLFKKDCKACPKGPTELQKAVSSVYIDPGMDSKDKITFEGLGLQKLGYTAGDVVFSIEQLPHHQFKRQGDNLHTTVYLTLLEALTGFNKTFHHVSNKLFKLERQGVIYDGLKEKFPDWGMPIRSKPNNYGHLEVTYRIRYPQKLSEESRNYIKKALASTSTWIHDPLTV